MYRGWRVTPLRSRPRAWPANKPGGPLMFIRNAWYVAAWADEIEAGPLARRICNEPVVLYRDANNKAAALIDMCCHRGAPLHLGRVVQQGIECGYHGLVFDGNGTCVRIPG